MQIRGFDVAQSAYVAEKIKAKPKQCWHNCIAAMRSKWGKSPGSRYVEGWIVLSSRIMMEHGWLTNADGTTAIDPTVILVDEHRANPSSITYFPGVVYTYNDLGEVFSKPRDLPLVGHRGLHTFSDYASAWREAYKYATGKEAPVIENHILGIGE